MKLFGKVNEGLIRLEVQGGNMNNIPINTVLCRVFFHISNDVITLPFIVDENVHYLNGYKFTKKDLLLEVINRFKTETGFIINDIYYSNNILTKIELSDINSEYAKT